MEKEKKYFKGMVIGLLCVVVMLFGIVINIGKTYSLDTTPSCINEGGVEFVWTTTVLNSSKGACCPKNGSGYDSLTSGGKCTAVATKADNCTNDSDASCYSCPKGYSLASNNVNGNVSYFCSTAPGSEVQEACYSCNGRYAWGDSVTSYNCPSSWKIESDITKESDCKSTANTYEVTFETDDGTFYIDNKLASSTSQSLSTIEWSKYSAKKTGYVFKGWTTTKTSDCASAYTSGSSNVVSKKTVYACYESEAEKKYTVTLNANGGLVVISKNNVVKDTELGEYKIENLSNGYVLALSDYQGKKTGKEFKGWSKSATCSNIIRVYTISSNNATLYACYSDSNSDNTTYSATFNPNGGTFSDGTTVNKTVKYTGKKYFTDSDITVTKTGFTFIGWRSSNGDLGSYIDSTENGDTLIAIWQDNSSSDSGNVCEFESKEVCEFINDDYTCELDSNGCYVKGSLKEGNDDNSTCEFESKSVCEDLNEGYNCKIDSNGCYVKSSKKTDSSSSSNNEPTSNPNTGSSLLYLAIVMAIGTIGYTFYYVFKLKKEN